MWGLMGSSSGVVFLNGVLWGIWRERNSRTFEGKIRSCIKVVDSILHEEGSWLLFSREFECPLVVFISDWVSCIFSAPPLEKSFLHWQPPPVGFLKLNFDGSS